MRKISSGLRMLAVVNAWVKGRPVLPMKWSRHGPVPVLFDRPFLKLGKMFVSPDFVLSFHRTVVSDMAWRRDDASSLASGAYLGLVASIKRPAMADLDLQKFCQPQSFMVRFWTLPSRGLF